MAVEIITRVDLEEFRVELVAEIAKLLKSGAKESHKRWLKTAEVKKLLGISSGTLQNLRVNGSLPYTKLGGVLYYDREEIEKMLELNSKIERRPGDTLTWSRV